MAQHGLSIVWMTKFSHVDTLSCVGDRASSSANVGCRIFSRKVLRV